VRKARNAVEIMNQQEGVRPTLQALKRKALAGGMGSPARDHRPPACDRRAPSASTASPVFRPSPRLTAHALHRLRDPARGAPAEGATLYQAARDPLLLELASPCIGSLLPAWSAAAWTENRMGGHQENVPVTRKHSKLGPSLRHQWPGEPERYEAWTSVRREE
jgi:hypothetical protein